MSVYIPAEVFITTGLHLPSQSVSSKQKSPHLYHFIPIRMATIKNKTNGKNQMLASVRKHRNSCALLVGTWNGVAPVENMPAVPQKAKHGAAMWSSNSPPHPGTYPKEGPQTLVH